MTKRVSANPKAGSEGRFKVVSGGSGAFKGIPKSIRVPQTSQGMKVL